LGCGFDWSLQHRARCNACFAQAVFDLSKGALKMREWKMQEWKLQEKTAAVEIAGVEKA